MTVEEVLGELAGGVLCHHQDALALILLLYILGGDLFLLYLDIVFLRQVTERFGIGEMLMLHDEVDGVASLAAAETLEDAFCGRDGERRGLLVMKRTQSQVVDASLLQRHELLHHLGYLGSVENPFYS